MLIFGSKLIGMPIMGLQTGTQLAITKMPVIDPSNLRVIAYEVDGPLLSERPSFLRINDVREISNVGMIIDSNDEFVGLEDVIKIKTIYNLDFKLIGMNVINENKTKLGKVESYNIDSDNFTVQQLNIKQGFVKSITESGMLIHRSQIIEINLHNIIVKTTAKKLSSLIKSEKLNYTNPFRNTSTQTDNN